MRYPARLHLAVLLVGLCSTSTLAQVTPQIEYGLRQDPSDPRLINVVIQPNFSHPSVSITTAVVSLLLPHGSVTEPVLPRLPIASELRGTPNNITGSWIAEVFTEQTFSDVSLPVPDLEGNDIYTFVLIPGTTRAQATTAGTPVTLFSFGLLQDCTGSIALLTNNHPIQQRIFNAAFINLNNSMALSIGSNFNGESYTGNQTGQSTLTCPLLDDQPSAADDSLTIAEDSTNNHLNPLFNDDFGSNNNFAGNPTTDDSVSIASAPLYGTVNVDNSGTVDDPTDDRLVYTPNRSFSGTDSMVYSICDADGDCASASISVNVVDQGFPVAENDTGSTGEDTPTAIPWSINDAFTDNAFLSDFEQPGNGLVSRSDAGTAGDPSDDFFNYQPNSGFNGDDFFSYTLCDDDIEPQCSSATVSITVIDAGNPTAVTDSVVTGEDITASIAWPVNDQLIDDVSLASFTQAGNGTVNADDNGTANAADDQFSYVPNPAFHGEDSFSYTICDDDLPTPSCSSAEVSISVVDAGSPVATNDAAITTEDNTVEIAWSMNDSLADNALLDSLGSAAHGSVSANDNGSPQDPLDDVFIYQPNADFNGRDSFSYTVCDDDATCSTASVSILVAAANDPPEAIDDFFTVQQRELLTANLLDNDRDIDGDTFTLMLPLSSTPANGDFTINPDGSFAYQINSRFTGEQSFSYQICDTGQPTLCATASALIRVTARAIPAPVPVPSLGPATPLILTIAYLLVGGFALRRTD